MMEADLEMIPRSESAGVEPPPLHAGRATDKNEAKSEAT
jgi:hypothetical protein